MIKMKEETTYMHVWVPFARAWADRGGSKGY